MRTATHNREDTALRESWLQTIAYLEYQVKTWVREEPGWAMSETETKAVEEAPLGEYTVAVSEILTPDGEKLLR